MWQLPLWDSARKDLLRVPPLWLQELPGFFLPSASESVCVFVLSVQCEEMRRPADSWARGLPHFLSHMFRRIHQIPHRARLRGSKDAFSDLPYSCPASGTVYQKVIFCVSPSLFQSPDCGVSNKEDTVICHLHQLLLGFHSVCSLSLITMQIKHYGLIRQGPIFIYLWLENRAHKAGVSFLFF